MYSEDRESFMLVTFGGEDHVLEHRHITQCGKEVPEEAHSTEKYREESRISEEKTCPDCLTEIEEAEDDGKIEIEYAVKETELDNLPKYRLVEDGDPRQELELGALPDDWPTWFKSRVRKYMGLLCSRFPPNEQSAGPVARIELTRDDETPTITEVED